MALLYPILRGLSRPRCAWLPRGCVANFHLRYLLTSLCWPLIVVPLHYLNDRVLAWSHGAFAGLLLAGGVLVAFLLLCCNAYPFRV